MIKLSQVQQQTLEIKLDVNDGQSQKGTRLICGSLEDAIIVMFHFLIDQPDWVQVYFLKFNLKFAQSYHASEENQQRKCWLINMRTSQQPN